QARLVVVERRFHTEIVSAFLGGGYGCDLFHLERDRFTRKRREQNIAALAFVHLGNIALVDLEHHAERCKRRNLVQHRTPFDWRTERLAEIARHHHSIEWGCYQRAL